MKISIKTRDNCKESYLYEIHKAGCKHLHKGFLQVFTIDKFKNVKDFFKTIDDKNDYKIMNCIK